MAGGVSSPIIISVTIGAVLVLSVALVTIVRWARTKPSTQLPPPRPASLSPYWANQHRYSSYPSRVDVYDEERKLTAHGSGIFKPFGEYAPSNASDSSLYRGSKTPYTDGDRTPNSGASFGHENVGGGGTQSEHATPNLQPNELGEISLNSPQPPRQQRPTSIQFVPGMRPPSSFGSLPPNGSTFAMPGGDAQQAAATDPSSMSQNNQNAPPPSAFSHHPSPPRPFSTSSRSRHSIAGPPIAPQQPPPSFSNYQVKQDRRASRMSMYSTYSTHTFSYPDPRRSSVNSMNMIRGPPHKTNMQIILPQPLAPTAAPAAGHHGLPGNSNPAVNANYDADDSAIRRNQRRHSRVDMWTETNNTARARSPFVPLGDLPAAADGSRRNRRPSQGSEKSGRSLELPNPGQFMHMQPPPPLPAASSRSFLTSSRSATPMSSSSALPTMSSAMTTPQRTGSSSDELGHEKPLNPSSSTLNTAVDDAKPPQPPQDAAVKSDTLSTIPSVPLIEPTKDN